MATKKKAQPAVRAKNGNHQGNHSHKAAPPTEPAEQHDPVKAEIERLKRENQELREARRLDIRISPKGAVSIYGVGSFPATFYANQWEFFLDHSDEIREFIQENKSKLSWGKGLRTETQVESV